MLEETIINSPCSSLNNANNGFLSIIETPRGSMKKDVQSLVMLPSQDSINETVNNSELFIEMDTEIILTPKSTKKLDEMSGRRVVDIFTFIRDIQNKLCDHGPLFECSFKDMDIVSEKRCGLQKKKFPASSEKKRYQPKSRKLIFFGNSKKRYNNGPDQHYVLAEPLPEDNISKEELEKTKENFINALRLDKHERLAIEEKTRNQANIHKFGMLNVEID
ncbi:hypothetical protein QTP88_015699 [Uroleucon formosanum]